MRAPRSSLQVWASCAFASSACRHLAGYRNATGGLSTYQTSVPTNAGDAKVRGVALTLQHNFGTGFGVVANYTYSDSKTDGDYSLPYNSRNAYNISPYYEQGKWSARVNLGWRSEYFTEIGRLNGQQMTDAFTQVDASFGYQATERLRVALEPPTCWMKPTSATSATRTSRTTSTRTVALSC